LAKSAKPAHSVVHRTVRWRTGQCPVPQAGPTANWPLSGIGGATWLKITGLSGKSSVPAPKSFGDELVALGKRRKCHDYNSLDCPVSQSRPSQRSAAKSMGDVWPEPTVGWAHRTVRCAPDSVWCANGTAGPTVGCTRYGRGSSTGLLQDLSGGAPDCPMRHSTEGKNCLPS
jgi:hypothetical protein